MIIFGGRFKKRKLVTPRGMTTRPTLGKVRETLFNILQNEIEGATFLDLFAGSGAVGFEALSRGASFVTFVEKDRNAIRAIETNIAHLGVEKECRLIRSDVFKALESLSPFDIIFADPPYGKGFGERLIEMVEEYELTEGSLFIEENHSLLAGAKLQLQSTRRLGSTYLHQLQKD